MEGRSLSFDCVNRIEVLVRAANFRRPDGSLGAGGSSDGSSS